MATVRFPVAFHFGDGQFRPLRCENLKSPLVANRQSSFAFQLGHEAVNQVLKTEIAGIVKRGYAGFTQYLQGHDHVVFMGFHIGIPAD